MNRFDNSSVSAYTPQSFQELAFTPLLKRQQHDEMAKNLAALDAIAVDPLHEHRERALQLKKDLESKLGNLSGELASKGIDGIGRENFYRLKKEHDDLIAPTGKIGQINAAKIAEAATKKQFFDSADKRIPQDVLERNWQEHRSKYTGYTDPDKKIISNIDSLGSVGYQDLESDIKDKAPLLGETTKTKLRDLGARYEMRPQGMILVTGDGKEITTENSQQLNELGKVLKSKYFDDKGEGYAYNKFAGKDQQNQLDILNNSLKMMIDDKTVKDMNTNYQHINYPEGSGDGENSNDPSGIIISNDSTLTSDATAKTTYSDAHNEIKRLQNSPSLSPIDKAKLEDLKELRQDADNKLKQNKNYSILDSKFKTEYSKWEKLASKMNLSTQEKESIKKDPNILPQLLFSKGVSSFKGSKNDSDLKLILDNKNLSSINEVLNKRQKIKDDVWKESSSLRHNYSYMPSTPKEEGVWNLHNENVYNTLKGIPDLNNVLDLTSVYTTGGTNKNITPEDVSNIQTLLKNGDPKSFKINNVKTYGDNKTPEVTMTFNTNEDAPEFDSKGVKWNDEYGGSKKPVTVTFKLKKFSNSFDTGSAAGYKNLTGAIANFWKDKGGINEITGNFQGAEVYNSMIENAYSNISDKELYARAQSDADAREALLIRVAKHQSKKQ